MATMLPQGFEQLEPFVDRFAVAGTANRARLRSESGEAERAAFVEAARDLVAPALDLLDQKPLADLDEAERRLLDLALTFAHMALAVEVQGADEARHAQMRDHMRITRSPADALA
jgi:hypothetical protein